MLKREEIRIRDPFIYVDRENKKYYMYGTTCLEENQLNAENKFFVYVSSDLENFDGPFVVFDGKEESFWGTYDFWAAEVYKYKEKYYLFGSFKTEGKCRATQILESDSLLGPFKCFSNKAKTPNEWDCLDGTFWVENDIPYMIFSHEWVQCEDGEIYAIELSQDLKSTVGEPFLLFRASDNPYVKSFSCDGIGENCRVTDGPFVFKDNGKLKMIWSSMERDDKYAVFEATALTLRGEWFHTKSRFDFDGGHAMIFKALDGKKYFSMHKPNITMLERAIFIPYE